MSALESTWIYVAVPAATIAILVLLKLKLQKTHKTPEDKENTLQDNTEENPTPSTNSEQEPPPQELTTERTQHTTVASPPTKSVETQRERTETPETVDDQEKPGDCRHYMGFLYMRKGPENANIPTECYGCRRLLRCLYSPQVIEKVYGE